MKIHTAVLLLALAAPSIAAAHPCPEYIPGDVPLTVDNIDVSLGMFVNVTVSGFPPGFFRVKCSVHDKDGKYLHTVHMRSPAVGRLPLDLGDCSPQQNTTV
jgi:hypothetical protein